MLAPILTFGNNQPKTKVGLPIDHEIHETVSVLQESEDEQVTSNLIEKNEQLYM